jgi:hypothetical protein
MSNRLTKLQAPLPERVVDLGAARDRQRFERYRLRTEAVLDDNRQAMQRLFESGHLFSRHGTRIGRDLLRGHQHLLRVHDLIHRGSARGDAPRTPAELDALFEEIESLLEKTSAIARRNKGLFQSTPGL